MSLELREEILNTLVEVVEKRARRATATIAYARKSGYNGAYKEELEHQTELLGQVLDQLMSKSEGT